MGIPRVHSDGILGSGNLTPDDAYEETCCAGGERGMVNNPTRSSKNLSLENKEVNEKERKRGEGTSPLSAGLEICRGLSFTRMKPQPSPSQKEEEASDLSSMFLPP